MLRVRLVLHLTGKGWLLFAGGSLISPDPHPRQVERPQLPQAVQARQAMIRDLQAGQAGRQVHRRVMREQLRASTCRPLALQLQARGRCCDADS